MTPAMASRWTCAGCGVAASRSDTEVAPLPESWETGLEGTFCLGCRRNRVGEAALNAAPASADRDARVRLRRNAVVEFEVRRVPEKTNGSIARVCRTSIPTVRAARQRLSALGSG